MPSSVWRMKVCSAASVLLLSCVLSFSALIAREIRLVIRRLKCWRRAAISGLCDVLVLPRVVSPLMAKGAPLGDPGDLLACVVYSDGIHVDVEDAGPAHRPREGGENILRSRGRILTVAALGPPSGRDEYRMSSNCSIWKIGSRRAVSLKMV